MTLNLIDHRLLLLVLAGAFTVQGQVTTCATQQPCMTVTESACVAGSRTICLGFNFGATSCSATDALNGMCGLLTGDIGTDIRVGAGSSCVTVTGGTTARFAVSDGTAATSGSLTGDVVISGTSVFKTGSCVADSRSLCSGVTGSTTNTIWSFTANSCSCNCNTWSAWGSCSASCQRTRTRTCSPLSTDVTCSTETETEACTGGSCLGCSCDPTWSAWGTCSSTCQGGVQTRTRNCTAQSAGVTCDSATETQVCGTSTSCVDASAYRCDCGGWTGWAACSNTCGTGSQSRTRTCTPIPPIAGPPVASCPASVFPLSQTQACTGNSFGCNNGCSCGSWTNVGACSATCGLGTQQQQRTCSNCPSTTPTTQTVACNTGVACPPAPTVNPGVCSCGDWLEGQCSVECGGGTAIETRLCNSACDLTTIITRIVSCNTDSCGGDGGNDGGRVGGGRRGGRRRRVRCNRRFRTRAARRRCRRRNRMLRG